MKSFDITVVGTGLSSVGIIKNLISSKKKILIINSEKHNNIKKNFGSPEICEEELPVPISNKLNFKNKPFLKLQELEISGGNTNFWGGYCCRFDKDDFKSWPINYKKMETYYSEAEKILGINKKKNTNILTKNSNSFLLNKSQIANDRNGIFNSKNIISKLLKSSKFTILNSSLKKLIYKNNFYELILEKNKSVFTKKLILCTGVLNTEKIIKNSFKNLRIKNIEQAQSFILPGILTKKTKSKFDIQVFSKKKKLGSKIYFEVKKDPVLLRNSLTSRSKLLKFIPSKIIDKIIVIWGFVPSNLSYKYQINNKKIIINNKEYKKSFRTKKFIKNILKIFEKNSYCYLLFNLLKVNQYARSYHLGCNIPMSNKVKYHATTNLYGELRIKKVKKSCLYIVGSSIFPNLPSKSFGLTLLANSLRIGKKLSNEKN